MFGPLPALHRLLVALAALVVGAASGMWIARFSSAPTAAVAGAAWGALTGALLTYVLLHDFHRRPHRVRTRRH